MMLLLSHKTSSVVSVCVELAIYILCVLETYKYGNNSPPPLCVHEIC
jgi:hypothetical protein